MEAPRRSERAAAPAAGGTPPDWPTPELHARWRREELRAYPGVGLAVARGNAGRPKDVLEQTRRYGRHPGQRLVVVRPAEGARARGLVVFVHGGSWQSGSPERYRFIGRWFARRGFVTGVIGYRHAPAHRFPAQLDDVFSAWSALRGLAPGLGANPDGAIVAGQSAGAHLAALAAFDGPRRATAGIPDDAVGAVVLVSGPLDLGLLCPRKDLCPLVGTLMGDVATWDPADPALALPDAVTWPLFVAHGERDPLVNVAGSVSFAHEARSRGASVTLEVAPRGHHVDLVRTFVEGDPRSRALDVFIATTADDRYAGPGVTGPARPERILQ